MWTLANCEVVYRQCVSYMKDNLTARPFSRQPVRLFLVQASSIPEGWPKYRAIFEEFQKKNGIFLE